MSMTLTPSCQYRENYENRCPNGLWVKFGYVKTLAKELVFNVGGHMLHTVFWENLAPAGKGCGGQPYGAIGELINKKFGSFNTFKKLFSATVASMGGLGWQFCYATLPRATHHVPIEKHNINLISNFQILLAIDVGEHTYYIDCKNERSKFIGAFWNIGNWDKINKP